MTNKRMMDGKVKVLCHHQVMVGGGGELGCFRVIFSSIKYRILAISENTQMRHESVEGETRAGAARMQSTTFPFGPFGLGGPTSS